MSAGPAFPVKTLPSLRTLVREAVTILIFLVSVGSAVAKP